MVFFGNHKLISVHLSKKERQFLLNNCELGDTDLTNRIVHASDEPLRLMEHEAGALKTALSRLWANAENTQHFDLLSTLVEKIVLDASTNTLFHNLPLAMKSRIRRARSLPEGLTSEQIVRFHDYSWGDAEFPLQFDHSLSLEEANRSVFFRNARLFLNTLIECTDQTIATAKKNLNRKLVRQMFDQMEIDEKHRKFLACCKVLNEKDVFALHLIRIICECAGLTKYHSQTFVVPKKHCALLSEDTAGELYYLLFHAYFNKFNMSYVDGLPEVGGLQGGCDYSLYRIGMLCDDHRGRH